MKIINQPNSFGSMMFIPDWNFNYCSRTMRNTCKGFKKAFQKTSSIYRSPSTSGGREQWTNILQYITKYKYMIYFYMWFFFLESNYGLCCWGTAEISDSQPQYMLSILSLVYLISFNLPPPSNKLYGILVYNLFEELLVDCSQENI